MFNFFPFFNKFRAPMMALVLMQLSFPILAALAFEEILRVWKLKSAEEDLRLSKAILFIPNLFTAALIGFWISGGNPFFGIGLTIAIFLGLTQLIKRTRTPFIAPIFLVITIVGRSIIISDVKAGIVKAIQSGHTPQYMENLKDFIST